MTKQTLVIRADANVHMGTGHVMRCLALGQVWQELGGDVHFIVADLAPALADRLRLEGMQVIFLADDVDAGSRVDAQATAETCSKNNASWVVVDGYQFDADYQRQLKQTGLRLLFIDDYAHASHYFADIVLNQNIYAQADLYPSREPYTRLLLGTEYVLLRREFWAWRDWQRPISDKARKILVTLGGSDPDNVTLMVIQALQQLPDDDWSAIVVVGGQNPHYQELVKAVTNDPRIQLRQNATNMPDLMAWADIAVSAGGSTCWELCFMGLPTIILVLAENQTLAVNHLVLAGAMQLVTEKQPSVIAQMVIELCINVEQRQHLNRNSHDLVKGYGCFFMVKAISNTITGGTFNEQFA